MGLAGDITGKFDSATKRALLRYQQASLLPVTGMLDVPTWQSLLANPPAKVRWRAGKSSAGVVHTGPSSSRLRPRAKEIPAKPHG